jgi:exopolysaccharide production protein ExoQ
MVISTQALTESRLLVENGWMLLVLLAVKSREPFDNLEPMGMTSKLKKLARAASKRAK